MPWIPGIDNRLGQILGVIDVELTNRCNAHCSFCPREQTPHQGLMAPAVLDQVVARVIELRDGTDDLWPSAGGISFCGLGDQLLNPHVAEFVAKVRGAGLDVTVNTNAALLDEERGQRLLDAGVTAVCINAGELGARYEEVYGLPFERLAANLRRFVEASADRCQVYVVLVDHSRDTAHLDEVEAFWRELGVFRFMKFDVINRAGSLSAETHDLSGLAQYAEAKERLAAADAATGCRAPFHFPFIGYDGEYYLCSSDWKKEASVGNVFDHSILSVIPAKFELLNDEHSICATCTHHHVNRLTNVLLDRDDGLATDAGVDQLVADLEVDAADSRRINDRARQTISTRGAGASTTRRPRRRQIPVRASG